MKKSVATIALSLLIAGILSGCGHQHVWKEATCTEPKTCTECGETEGSPLGHTWAAATCTAPKTCTVCGATEGNPLEHTWVEATCTTPKTCSVCGETEGGLAEHDLNSTGKCRVCGEQVGFALNMSNYGQYLKFKFEQNKDVSGNITGFTAKIEPIKNAKFYNVSVTASATINAESYNSYSSINGKTGLLMRNGKYYHKLSDTSDYTIKIDEQGYGSYTGTPTGIGKISGITVTLKGFSNGGIKNISGYIVE